MGVLADWQIGMLSDDGSNLITIDKSSDNYIDPPQTTISHGVSSYGYDLRIGKKHKLYRRTSKEPMCNRIIDPTESMWDVVDEVEGDLIIPPHGFALSESIERVNIPRRCLGICTGKSTWARCGLITPVTPIEPEFEGTITLELVNVTDFPIRVRAGVGIVQLNFLVADALYHSNIVMKSCEFSYKDKKGKYQNQTGVTLPK